MSAEAHSATKKSLISRPEPSYPLRNRSPVDRRAHIPDVDDPLNAGADAQRKPAQPNNGSTHHSANEARAVATRCSARAMY